MKIAGSFVFRICDENLNFDEINNKIDLEATKTLKRGEVTIANSKAPFDIWSVETKITDEEDIMGPLNSMLDKLLPFSDYIYKMNGDYSEVSINLHIPRKLRIRSKGTERYST